MADAFTYNGVSIGTPNIEIVSAEAVYAEDDRQVMYTKTILRVKGVLQSETFSADYATLKNSLLTTHGNLLVQFGTSAPLFNITAPDDNYGPKPRRCELSEMTGGRFAFVVFEIEVAKQSACASPSNIIAHTYSTQHQLDSLYMTTRTLKGKVRVRSTATNNPDLLRGLVVPALPDGFRRESMNFLVSADGVQLDYEVVDKEVYQIPPSPAIKASARFAHQIDNYRWFNHFSIEVEGAKTATKLDLFGVCFQIAASRIDFTTEFIQQAVIEEEIYENIVRFTVTSWKTNNAAGTTQGLFFPTNSAIFTGTPHKNNFALEFGPYGTAMIASAINAFYDPCTSDATNIRASQTGAPGTGGASASSGSDAPSGGGFSGSSTTLYSAEQLANPYTIWQQDETYDTENGMALMPSAYASAPATVYQFHNPYTVITIKGYAKRTGAVVFVPSISIPKGGFLIVNKVTANAPELMPDKKTLSYSAVWYYEIIVPEIASDLTSDSGLIITKIIPAIPGNNAINFAAGSKNIGVTTAQPILITATPPVGP